VRHVSVGRAGPSLSGTPRLGAVRRAELQRDGVPAGRWRRRRLQRRRARGWTLGKKRKSRALAAGRARGFGWRARAHPAHRGSSSSSSSPEAGGASSWAPTPTSPPQTPRHTKQPGTHPSGPPPQFGRAEQRDPPSPTACMEMAGAGSCPGGGAALRGDGESCCGWRRRRTQRRRAWGRRAQRSFSPRRTTTGRAPSCSALDEQGVWSQRSSSPRRTAAGRAPDGESCGGGITELSEGGRGELGRVGPCGWRRSGIALYMAWMGGDGKMKDVPQDATAGRKTPSVSSRMAFPVRMV
jgi:hypothetical protein